MSLLLPIIQAAKAAYQAIPTYAVCKEAWNNKPRSIKIYTVASTCSLVALNAMNIFYTPLPVIASLAYFQLASHPVIQPHKMLPKKVVHFIYAAHQDPTITGIRGLQPSHVNQIFRIASAIITGSLISAVCSMSRQMLTAGLLVFVMGSVIKRIC